MCTRSWSWPSSARRTNASRPARNAASVLPDPVGFLARMEPAMQRAYDQMEALEKGAIANPDEKRRVGHYWLRDSSRAPELGIKQEIDETVARIQRFATDVHHSRVRGDSGHFM